MKDVQTNWTKKEFLAYLLIYCMQVDAVEQESEIAFIRNKVGDEVYNEIYKEFSVDKDYTSISKIQNAFKELNFDVQEKGQIITDIKEIFKIDGSFDMIEKGVMSVLNRILKD